MYDIKEQDHSIKIDGKIIIPQSLCEGILALLGWIGLEKESWGIILYEALQNL